MRLETTKSCLLNLLVPAILLLAFKVQAQSEKANLAAWNLLKATRETHEVLPPAIKNISALLVFP